MQNLIYDIVYRTVYLLIISGPDQGYSKRGLCALYSISNIL